MATIGRPQAWGRPVTRLSIRRRLLGFKSGEIAVLVKASNSAYSALECGTAAPGFALALRVAGVLNCSVHDLWEVDEGGKVIPIFENPPERG